MDAKLPLHTVGDLLQFKTKRETPPTPEPKRSQWLSPPPRQCDLCHSPITDVFVDGKTRSGPWGALCPRCHRAHGLGLGTGRGQKYKLTRDNETGKVYWIKVAG